MHLRPVIPAACLIVLAPLVATVARDYCMPLPDRGLSVARMSDCCSTSATLLVVPDGSGPGFSGARTVGGQPFDARIVVRVLDGGGLPFVQLPYEAMDLRWVTGNVAICWGAMYPDRWTDLSGETIWTRPPHAGGHGESLCVVFVCGGPLTSSMGVPLKVNSPDLDGNLSVDLADIGLFAGDYFGAYAFRSDLSYDGVVNLADIGVLAQHQGAACR